MGIIAWIAVSLIVGLLAKLPSRVGSLTRRWETPDRRDVPEGSP
jgi:hypothetical protein